MKENASLLLCNLAGQHGLKRAREILAEKQAAKVAPTAVTESQSTPPAPPVEDNSDAAAVDITPPAPAVSQREVEDEGARNATSKELRDALTQLGISFAANAKKADLLALFLARS